MFFIKIKSWPIVGLSFYWDAFGIKRMVWEKIVNSSFGGVAVPEMRTPSVGAGKPWVLSQTRSRHLALGLPYLCAG